MQYFMHAAKKTYLIGVDLGGTNVRAGLVQNGKIIALQTREISFPKANLKVSLMKFAKSSRRFCDRA